MTQEERATLRRNIWQAMADIDTLLAAAWYQKWRNVLPADTPAGE